MSAPVPIKSIETIYNDDDAEEYGDEYGAGDRKALVRQ